MQPRPRNSDAWKTSLMNMIKALVRYVHTDKMCNLTSEEEF